MNTQAGTTVEAIEGDATVTGEGEINSVTVTTEVALNAAIDNPAVSKIILGEGIIVTAPVVIDRAVTIDGNNQELAFGFDITVGDVVINNLTVTGSGFTDNVSGDSAIYVRDTAGKPVTFDGVKINYTTNKGIMVSGISTASPSSYIIVRNSTFFVKNEFQEGADSSIYTYGKIEVTNSKFNGAAGIVIDHSEVGNVVDIKGNEFNGTWVGVSLFNSASMSDKTREETKAYVLDANSFNDELGDYKVSARDN
ncbi:pectate lyase-like adhesive domain-containing protein [Ureibacillus acetophenoni]|uniref:Right handed beta helix domain-containing protein n=1 Tax=Ureibacillus acetophenoni TaxID=614649 RepID=A0A285U3F5_9BACL|nr:pectate lyase-like adhesive domain-containing protein [Ureibacillus acetophenoni]SOC34781.1 hypothetical protein SAMN05877842_101110 [Ureibacillus acetophenoni]